MSYGRSMWLAVLTLLCAAACTVRTYEGPKRELNEVARIRPIDPAAVQMIDGKKFGGFVQYFELLPGRHELVVAYEDDDLPSLGDCTLTVNVEPGRYYYLVVRDQVRYPKDVDSDLEKLRYRLFNPVPYVWNAWVQSEAPTFRGKEWESFKYTVGSCLPEPISAYAYK